MTEALSKYLRTENWTTEALKTPPLQNVTIVEAVSLVNAKDSTIVRVALMQAGGKTFLQAAAEREKTPLSRGVFTKMLKKLAPGVKWEPIPGHQLHAVAFLS